LDLGRWTGLWNRLGAEGDGLPVFTRLVTAYSEPARFYHNTSHICDCLALVDWSRHTAHRPDEVEAGLWFHDAVYDPERSDNEERSADFARTALAGSGVAADVAGRVAELVLATGHLVAATDPDAALLCDIDLSILGRSPVAFAQFEQQIRREYSWVPENAYRGARSEILRRFLRRTSIYQTALFRDRYEGQARTNLEQALKFLDGEAWS
jgi:predicted metal-dependent HD superfamily phosphohydrolase